MTGQASAGAPSVQTPVRSSRRLGRTLSRARWGEYRRVLEHALSRDYRVVSLEDWLFEQADADATTLVLRHDVDQHPRAVLPMLAAERDLGLSSTWYFRWRTADPRTIARVRDAGGAVGLHYETLTRRLLAGRGDDPSEETLIAACRDELRAEIRSFAALFGPIRTICPHGDTRVPGVTNQVLLRGMDPHDFGVAFDGNEAMSGRRLAAWLTDRSAPEGGWNDGVSPCELLDERLSPILCVTHPNNFVSGPALWADRILASALPTPAPGRARLVQRTGADAPPAPAELAFGPVASALESEVRRYYEQRGKSLEGAAGRNTLLTNSHFAERRLDTLLGVLSRRAGLDSVQGLDVLDLGCGFGALAVALAFKGARAVGLDPHADRLSVGEEVARRHGLPVELGAGRMESLDRGAESFDLVILNNSFCYLVDRAARAEALRRVLRVLRPGGMVVLRNPNRLYPIDHFTRIPMLALLPPQAAAAVSRALGRKRSNVRLTSVWAARRELLAAGFGDVHAAGGRPGMAYRWLTPILRYQHVVGRRPLPER